MQFTKTFLLKNKNKTAKINIQRKDSTNEKQE